MLVCMSRAPGPVGGSGHSGTPLDLHRLRSFFWHVWGGLCVPGAPGPSSGAGEPYAKVVGGVYGSGDLRFPPAHG